MRSRAVFAALAGIVAIGLAGGCGLLKPKSAETSAPPSAPASPSAAAPDPAASAKALAEQLPDVCTLLSEPELTALTKYKITKNVSGGGIDSSKTGKSCQWEKAAGPVLVVGLYVEAPSAFRERIDLYDEVRGVGDAAYQNQWILDVLHGNIDISVALVDNNTGLDSPAPQKAIALKLIAKLNALKNDPSPTSSPSPTY